MTTTTMATKTIAQPRLRRGETLYLPPMFLALSGIIGAGKSRLAERIGKRYGIDVYYELSNEDTTAKIAKFYSDKKAYALWLQYELLNMRATQQDSIPADRPAIFDRSLYDDAPFAYMLHAEGFISDDAYETYKTTSYLVRSKMRKPSAIVYLDVEPEEALRRIRQRNRGMETGVTVDYLRSLRDAYEKFLPEISREIPVIRIDWSVFPEDVEPVVDAIVEALSKLSMVIRVKPNVRAERV